MPATTIPRKTDRITKRNGVDAYGLQVEFVRYFRSSKDFHSQVQIFLSQNALFVYERSVGAKTARWQGKTYDDHFAAKDAMRKLIEAAESDSLTTEIVGNPVLVQLTETDVNAIKEGLKPTVRFDAGLRNVRLFGKIDDDTWSPKNA